MRRWPSRSITLSGDTALSGDDVRSRLEGLRGLNTMTVNLEEWRQKVLESPWVEAVAIRRVLPGAVDVSIVERRPMGVGRIGSALYLIDERGVVIDEYGPNPRRVRSSTHRWPGRRRIELGEQPRG